MCSPMRRTYDELSEFGRLRKVDLCGPYAMFDKLVHEWRDRMTPSEVRETASNPHYDHSLLYRSLLTLPHPK